MATAALLGGAMFLLWLWSLAIRNASIIDIAWGPAFVVLAWRMYLTTPATPMRTLVVALVTWDDSDPNAARRAREVGASVVQVSPGEQLQHAFAHGLGLAVR